MNKGRIMTLLLSQSKAHRAVYLWESLVRAHMSKFDPPWVSPDSKEADLRVYQVIRSRIGAIVH
jgi:hypothetical protein